MYDRKIRRLTDKRAKEVLRLVCIAFKTTPVLVLSKSRQRYRCVYPRFFSWVLNNVLYDIPSTQSALIYRMNHASVLNGISVVTSCIYHGDREMKIWLDRVLYLIQDQDHQEVYARIINLYKIRKFNSQSNILTHSEFYKNLKTQSYGKSKKIY